VLVSGRFGSFFIVGALLVGSGIGFNFANHLEARTTSVVPCATKVAEVPRRLPKGPPRPGIRIITNFQRSPEELEAFLLFSMAVAGKPARVIEPTIERFLGRTSKPFAYLRRLDRADRLIERLHSARLGKYGILTQGYRQLVWGGFDLKTVTVEDLENIYGIGPKTSRFFIMHSRRNQRMAVLDRHILAWLRDLGYDTPKDTPGAGPRYKYWEQVFLKECRKRHMSPARLDYQIWLSRRL